VFAGATSGFVASGVPLRGATMPDATMPDATMPDATMPGAAALSPAEPGAAVPDMLVADLIEPDATLPEALASGAMVPDVAVPNPVVPDAVTLFPSSPNVIVSDVAELNAVVPDTAGSEESLRDAAVPDATVPDATGAARVAKERASRPKPAAGMATDATVSLDDPTAPGELAPADVSGGRKDWTVDASVPDGVPDGGGGPAACRTDEAFGAWGEMASESAAPKLSPPARLRAASGVGSVLETADGSEAAIAGIAVSRHSDRPAASSRPGFRPTDARRRAPHHAGCARQIVPGTPGRAGHRTL